VASRTQYLYDDFSAVAVTGAASITVSVAAAVSSITGSTLARYRSLGRRRDAREGGGNGWVGGEMGEEALRFSEDREASSSPEERRIAGICARSESRMGALQF
jgi:hypothetical protein